MALPLFAEVLPEAVLVVPEELGYQKSLEVLVPPVLPPEPPVFPVDAELLPLDVLL